jgi:hypothetical protein
MRVYGIWIKIFKDKSFKSTRIPSYLNKKSFFNLLTAKITFLFTPKSSDPKFHCHVCTSEETFLRIFNQRRTPGFLQNFTPTKKWKISKNHPQQSMADLFIENVKNYKSVAIATAKNYQQDEIGLISKFLIENDHANDGHDISINDLSNSQWFNIEFDDFEPKVRI